MRLVHPRRRSRQLSRWTSQPTLALYVTSYSSAERACLHRDALMYLFVCFLLGHVMHGAKYTVMSMSASLSTCVTPEPHSRTSPNFLCTLPVSAARSSSGGVVVGYVFPVLGMTSCFRIMGSVARHLYS